MAQLPAFEVNVAVLPRAGLVVELRPTAKEMDGIAEASGVNRFEKLEADLKVRRWRAKGVDISGEIRARVEQDCVVTLEPVFQDIAERFEATFLPEGSKLSRSDKPAEELILDPEGPDLPETFSGDVIDVWPVVMEFLVLAIDPFPRAEGAEIDPAAAGSDEPAEERESPFAALAKLKNSPS